MDPKNQRSFFKALRRIRLVISYALVTTKELALV